MTSLTVVSTASDNHFSSSMSPTTYLVLSSTGSSKPDATGTRPVPSAIAPKRSHATDHGLLRTTRKAHMEKGPGPAVARRNERERNRVRQVNQGFATLRQHVPQPGAKAKKMSKVETLRSAVQYIKQLQQLLNDTTGQSHDENSLPPMEEFASYHHSHQYSSRHHHEGSTEAGGFDLTSPSPSSPTPSLGSDASSPYDSLGPEEEELLDFTAWLS